ncbi:MAG: hypothetical protein Kow0029_11100 [Candidatus Rifleibacteriota bacterium]
MHRKKYSSGNHLIGAVFFALMLFPIYFTFWTYEQFLNEKEAQQKIAAQSALVSEMNDFQQALTAKTTIEGLLKKAEKELGLVLPSSENSYEFSEDPLIYDEKTPEKIYNYFKKHYPFQPVFVSSLGYYGDHEAYYFPENPNNCPEMLIQRLLKTIAANLASTLNKDYLNDYEFSNKILSYRENGKIKQFSGDTHVINNYLRYFFCGISEFPQSAGVCYEFATSRFGGTKTYMYTNGFKSAKKFSGGYFAVFCDKDITSEFLIKNALISPNINFSRNIVELDENIAGKVFSSRGRVYYFQTFPNAFFSNFNAGFLPDESVKKRKSYLLCVSTDESNYLNEVRISRTFLFFLSRFIFLISCMAYFYFILFGMPFEFSLRTKFILTTGIIVIIPFLLAAYSAGLSLKLAQNIKTKEFETLSESKKFIVEKFTSDLSIRRQLLSIHSKKVISDVVNRDPEAIKTFEPDGYFAKSLSEDVTFFRNDGYCRVICSIDKGKSPKRLLSLLASKYLNNLGTIDKESPSILRKLQLVSLASGFAEELAKDYLEGRALALESQDTKDLSELNNIYKMHYFLIADANDSSQEVKAICFRLLYGLSRFGNCYKNIGEHPWPILFEDDGLVKHRFAIGIRNVEGPIVEYFPNNINENGNLRLLLNYAAERKSSGRNTHKEGDRLEFSSWKYFPDDEVILAGISTSEKDLWLSYYSWVLPLIIALTSFISLLVFSDILNELLARPILAFTRFVKSIRNQNFETRIVIEATDELAILSDSFNSMANSLLQREKMRRFVSEKLYETVKKDHNISHGFAEESDLAVLASDIRGFTALTEQNDPTDIVALLNEYFSEMCNAIVENGGVVERFIGDAVIAIFYPDDTAGENSIRAVKAAIKMRKNLEKLNNRRRSMKKFQIENGIGIVTGKAVSAVTGTATGRKFFTVIGEPVARAANLEALTAKVKGSRILICGRTNSFCLKDPTIFTEEVNANVFIVKENSFSTQI